MRAAVTKRNEAEDIRTMRRNGEGPHVKRGLWDKDQRLGDKKLRPDVGLFEASNWVCPALPQYHPKQLVELLSPCKNRLKAVLQFLNPVPGHTGRSSPAHPDPCPPSRPPPSAPRMPG